MTFRISFGISDMLFGFVMMLRLSIGHTRISLQVPCSFWMLATTWCQRSLSWVHWISWAVLILGPNHCLMLSTSVSLSLLNAPVFLLAKKRLRCFLMFVVLCVPALFSTFSFETKPHYGTLICPVSYSLFLLGIRYHSDWLTSIRKIPVRDVFLLKIN